MENGNFLDEVDFESPPFLINCLESSLIVMLGDSHDMTVGKCFNSGHSRLSIKKSKLSE